MGKSLDFYLNFVFFVLFASRFFFFFFFQMYLESFNLSDYCLFA